MSIEAWQDLQEQMKAGHIVRLQDAQQPARALEYQLL